MTPLRVAAGIAALFSGAAMADDIAHAHFIHGAVCRQLGTSQKNLYVQDTGVLALSARGTEVICPIDRNYPVPVGQSFVVWIYGNSNNTDVSCSLTSYSYQGQYLGATGFDHDGGTLFQEEIGLPASEVPDGSVQEVHCKMGQGSQLYGFEPLL